ncbi:hypothetical protein Q3C01_43170 [Bradyrhizobium sp. UFLA05-109]
MLPAIAVACLGAVAVEQAGNQIVASDQHQLAHSFDDIGGGAITLPAPALGQAYLADGGAARSPPDRIAAGLPVLLEPAEPLSRAAWFLDFVERQLDRFLDTPIRIKSSSYSLRSLLTLVGSLVAALRYVNGRH